MILVGILDTTGAEFSSALVDTLSFNERERVLKIRNEERRKSSLFARLLLKKLYEELFSKKLPDVYYNEYGKPFFKDGLCAFSISHDKNIVAVSITDEKEKIGVDIQSFSLSRDSSLKIEKRFFSGIDFCDKKKKTNGLTLRFFSLKENNIEEIDTDSAFVDSEKTDGKSFFERWTELEACLKLFENGFADLKNVNECLQKSLIETLIMRHGGERFALSVAIIK